MPDPETEAYLDRVHRILVGLTLFCFGLLALAIVGEFLGWWSDLGEALAIVGAVGGIVLGAFTILAGASRRQVVLVGTGVEAANSKLNGIHGTLWRMDAKLGRLDQLDKLDSLEKLVQLDQLEAITRHLETQTGILVQIRDRA